MIGPPPSFYDPNQAVAPEGLDYQQWIMANYPGSSGQYGYGPGPGQAQASGNVPFQQQSQLHHVPVTSAPNQYNFVPEQQYGPDPGPSFDQHLVHQAQPTERPQRALPGARMPRRSAGVNYPVATPLRMPGAPTGAYQQSPSHQEQSFGLQSPAGTEGYYYPDSQPQAPQPQPQQQQQQQHSSYNFVGYQPDQYTAPSAAYTPGSDFSNLPSTGSTPSVGGADDGQTHTYAPLASQHGPPSAHPQTQQQPHASSSRHASGSGTRAGAGRGRGGKTSKRPRVEDPEDGGDSDSGSDSEPLQNTTGFATVSVPPPQGQGALPTRL